jgi:GNAT superfamily N-acetyltransferase
LAADWRSGFRGSWLTPITPYKFSIMDSPPGIRLARIEEASALSQLCIRSKAVWGYDEAFMALARVALEVKPEQITAGDVWVATAADGRPEGMVALGQSEEPDTLDLDKLFVEPQQIRTGVGRLLLSNAVTEARRRGAKRLTILADPYAAGFYERNGARLIGKAPSDAIPGRSLPLYEIKLA